MRRFVVLAVLATLPTLAVARPAWSELDGTSPEGAPADRADVAIVELDGRKLPVCASRPVRGDAGSGTGSLFGDHSGGRRAPKGACVTATRSLKLAPGAHAATVATTRLPAGGGYATQPFAFTAAPCVRYTLAAQHEGPGANRFGIVIAAQEPIAGCTAPADAAAVVAAPATDAPAAAPAPVEGAGTPAH
jgi:hypothetical protein